MRAGSIIVLSQSIVMPARLTAAKSNVDRHRPNVDRQSTNVVHQKVKGYLSSPNDVRQSTHVVDPHDDQKVDAEVGEIRLATEK